MRCRPPRRPLRRALLLLGAAAAAASTAHALAVEWPERLEQCQTALLRIADVSAAAAAVEVGVRRGRE
jgi:hypothetical protein